MTDSVLLGLYHWKVHKRRKPDLTIVLDAATPANVFDLFKSALIAKAAKDDQDVAKHVHDKKAAALYWLTNVVEENTSLFRYITARLWYGNYGSPKMIRDAGDMKIKHIQRRNQAAQQPHDLVIVLEKNAQIGWMALSHIGRPGGFSQIKDILETAFVDSKDLKDDHIFSIEPSTIHSVFEKYTKRLEGTAVSLLGEAPANLNTIFARKTLRAQGKGSKALKAKPVHIRMSVEARHMERLILGDNWWNGNDTIQKLRNEFSSVFSIPDSKINKVEVTGLVDKKKRTFVIGTDENHRTYLELQNVADDGNGYPLATDVVAKAKELIADVNK